MALPRSGLGVVLGALLGVSGCREPPAEPAIAAGEVYAVQVSGVEGPGAGSRSNTTQACPARMSRRTMFAPIRPRPTIPSCIAAPSSLVHPSA